MFVHIDGWPWLLNHTTKRFIAARGAAGVPHFRLHDLRYFTATQMLTAGVPIATVAQRLSHAWGVDDAERERARRTGR